MVYAAYVGTLHLDDYMLKILSTWPQVLYLTAFGGMRLVEMTSVSRLSIHLLLSFEVAYAHIRDKGFKGHV